MLDITTIFKELLPNVIFHFAKRACMCYYVQRKRGIMMSLKDILKNDRKQKEMTQEEYAKLIGITRGTLSHLERGREPSIDTSKKLSQYFGKPITELIGNKKIKIINIRNYKYVNR